MSVDNSTLTEGSGSIPARATGLTAYREVMRTPGAWPIAIASLVARMPNSMAGVALVLGRPCRDPRRQ
jgi:hypothetical protein